MDPSRITQIAQTIHNQLPDFWSIYVYGSQASNKALPESDLDVAVLGPEKISRLKLSETAQSTGISLQTQIDLVDLRSVPTDLQAQIVFKGKRTVLAEFNQVEIFEDFIFSSYARLNEERRFILADIQQRGSIYAG
ncbi:nucleotidyltransferase domain-containing protein [Verrucomicrobia bacterium]|nr:nucleotidyltransferase domain-containing protein [Verrucomicrobiota bacterium]